MVVIHTNTGLANQRETAGWLKQGFERHGLTVQITADKYAPGDLHVVQGPHYCYQEWLGKPNVLWLNRGFYGDARFDLSIGWLNRDGSRDFRNADKTEPNGTLPPMKAQKTRRETCIVFTDYGQRPESLMDYAAQHFSPWQTVHRPHPAEYPERSFAPLAGVWPHRDVAIGHASTVLVEAVLNGLHAIALDPRHVCNDMEEDRESWLIRLSWAMWNHTEIINGNFWSHLNAAT